MTARADVIEEIARHIEGWMPDPHAPSQECPECDLIRDLVKSVRRIASEAPVPSRTGQSEEAVLGEPRMSIVGTWLVQHVDRHTCGTGLDGHFGAHEPHCGEVPVVDLSTLPGWAPASDGSVVTERQGAVRALREAAQAWRVSAWADTPRYAERVQDRIAAAQFAGDWLEARATSLEDQP